MADLFCESIIVGLAAMRSNVTIHTVVNTAKILSPVLVFKVMNQTLASTAGCPVGCALKFHYEQATHAGCFAIKHTKTLRYKESS